MSKNYQKGISLIEIIVCVSIFLVLSLSVYGVFTSVINGITYYRERTTISSLADQYLEIVRNLPYSQIGTVQGNPHGPLADLANPVSIVVNKVTYQVYYAISYIDDPADGTILAGTDSAPNDYKQVKLYVKNTNTASINSFLTNASPKGLEGLASGGALSLEVFDANGYPVSGATIHIENNNVTPTIDLTRTADKNGKWIEVGLPNSDNSYHITATKTDYSSDKTYPSTTANPDPVKPDATVLNGQVTEISFSIDKLSNLTFSTLTKECQPISGIDLEIAGAKMIGTPSLLKFDNSYTSDSNGQVVLNNIEWDVYTPTLTSSSYMVYGTSPVKQANLLPNTIQGFNLLLGPKTDNSLLVIVKDASSTKNPIEGATVELIGATSYSGITSGSVWNQQSWTGGSGQSEFDDPTKYYQDDGNISTNEIPSAPQLAKIGSNHVSSGWLESSTFDTKTSSTAYKTLLWQPTSQDSETEIKFQVAANNDKTTWNYLGPDGTSSTFYTTPGSTINGLNNNRYVRYKAFLSNTNILKTPMLTSVNINYVSGCSSPGQVMFPELQNSTYQLKVTMDGYQSQTVSVVANGYKTEEIFLTP